mmetsp:Transcript_40358/g.126246  ORF Transcript_40358/g.126246 Transcript_40358/m.126246 type:complete len:355 (+) Transcript_40358:1669-2733(+)
MRSSNASACLSFTARLAARRWARVGAVGRRLRRVAVDAGAPARRSAAAYESDESERARLPGSTASSAPALASARAASSAVAVMAFTSSASSTGVTSNSSTSQSSSMLPSERESTSMEEPSDTTSHSASAELVRAGNSALSCRAGGALRKRLPLRRVSDASTSWAAPSERGLPPLLQTLATMALGTCGKAPRRASTACSPATAGAALILLKPGTGLGTWNDASTMPESLASSPKSSTLRMPPVPTKFSRASYLSGGSTRRAAADETITGPAVGFSRCVGTRRSRRCLARSRFSCPAGVMRSRQLKSKTEPSSARPRPRRNMPTHPLCAASDVDMVSSPSGNRSFYAYTPKKRKKR